MMADGSANPAGHSSSSQCTESEDSRGEIERQLHEDILLYLQEQRYRQECTKNEKRCIRRKAMRYTLEDGALLYTKQDKTKVRPMKLDYQFLAQIFENLMRAGGYYSLFTIFPKAQHTSKHDDFCQITVRSTLIILALNS